MNFMVEKTYLGMILDDAIKDMKLNKQQKIIKQLLGQAFMHNYEQLKEKLPDCLYASAYEVESKQTPIGQGDRNQYYRSTIYKPHFNDSRMHEFMKNNHKQFALLEVYSNNDEIRKKKNNKYRNSSKQKKIISGQCSKKIKIS